MSFIKILSTQFKKFTNSIFLNYDINKTEAVEKARKLTIKNLIELAKIFTCSPFDKILFKVPTESMMGSYDLKNIKKEGIKDLASEKNEVFSFENIKPSLVCFNMDGSSLCIITNNNKNEEEYKDLNELWKSQQYQDKKDLNDYKNMAHEDFLDEILIFFDLVRFQINKEKLKKICKDLENYIFVSDNFIKMVRILLNIEAKIPVILMGETGVGKTKLIQMLATLYGKGKCKWKKLQIHAGITDEIIISFIEKIQKEEKENNDKNELIWIFFDEINTCNSLGLLTEIICNHSYYGKKIKDNFVFLAACNPYRIIPEKLLKMKECGLIFKIKKII